MASGGSTRLSLVSKIAAKLYRAAPAGHPLGRPLANAAVVLLATGREEGSQIRRASLVGVQGMFFALFLLHPGTYAILIVTLYALYNVTDGIHAVSSSSSPSASWVFGATPFSGKQMVRGMEIAILLRNSLLPGLLVSICLYYEYEPLLATAILLTFIVYARSLISLALALRPRLPLSREMTGRQEFAGFMYSVLGNMAFAVVFVSIVGISRLSSFLGLCAAVSAVVILVVASWLISIWAGRRMSLVEGC